MTSSWEHPTSAWPLGAWIMAGILAIVTGLGVSANVLSSGLLLDAIALWPGLVPFFIALGVVAIRKGWRRRTGAIPPLLVITWIALTGGAHLGGWVGLPSSAGELIGPQAEPGVASLAISTVGRLVVGAPRGNHLYEVRFVRLGGSVGVPAAVETTIGEALNIAISEEQPSPWFRYAGWRLGLDEATEWNLSLNGAVSGDVSELALGSITLIGSGTLTLGSVDKATPVSVMGNFVLELPSGVAATVSGNVQTPPSWNGTSSPTAGEGWIFSVAEGGSLVIQQP